MVLGVGLLIRCCIIGEPPDDLILLVDLSLLVVSLALFLGCNYAADKLGGSSTAVELPDRVDLDTSRSSGGSSYQDTRFSDTGSNYQETSSWQKSSSSYQVADEELPSSRYQNTTSYSNEYNPDYSGTC